MWALFVETIVQCLGINRPLEREISAAPQIMVTVDSPRRRNVIEDHLIHVVGVDAIVTGGTRFIAIAESEAQVTNDYVRSIFNAKRVIAHANAIAGGRLAGDGDVRLVDNEARF